MSKNLPYKSICFIRKNNQAKGIKKLVNLEFYN